MCIFVARMCSFKAYICLNVSSLRINVRLYVCSNWLKLFYSHGHINEHIQIGAIECTGKLKTYPHYFSNCTYKYNKLTV